MAGQRQRLATKRFKAANPHLFPKPGPPSQDGPDGKTKKKKNKRIRKTLKGRVEKPGKGTRKTAYGKHPLRVPGKKPGEGCFICQSQDHIAKLCPKKAQWEKNKICLLCRRRGHSLKNCPDKDGANDQKLCYNCGEVGHSLSRCPKPLEHGGTKFASCFICNEQGHLSKNCPKNKHGIYPKGGSCKVCGGVTHLAKDCPEKGSKVSTSAGVESGSGSHHTVRQGNPAVLQSGDDLEDDFTLHEGTTSKNTKSSGSQSDLVSSGAENRNDSREKGKKSRSPKVVHFPG